MSNGSGTQMTSKLLAQLQFSWYKRWNELEIVQKKSTVNQPNQK